MISMKELKCLACSPDRIVLINILKLCIEQEINDPIILASAEIKTGLSNFFLDTNIQKFNEGYKEFHLCRWKFLNIYSQKRKGSYFITINFFMCRVWYLHFIIRDICHLW